LVLEMARDPETEIPCLVLEMAMMSQWEWQCRMDLTLSTAKEPEILSQ